MNKNKSYIAALSYSLIVGLSFLITKQVVPIAPPSLILAHRFFIALLGYAVFIKVSGQKIQLTKHKLLFTLPLTLYYPLLFFSLQVYGLKYATSSEAGIIFAMVPVLVVMIGLLMKQSISKIQAFCVIMSVSGVLVIFARNTLSFDGSFLGIALLFLSALSSAMYTITLKRVVTELSIYELTFIIIFTGFTVFNTTYFLEHHDSNKLIINYMMPFKSLSYTLGILYLSLFSSLGSTFASNHAIRHLSPPQFSVFSNLSTLISIIAGALILSEPLSLAHYIGSTFILAGVMGTNFSKTIEKGLTLAFKKT